MWIEATKNGKYKACERYTDPLTGKLRKVSVTIEKDNRQTRKAAQEELYAKIEEALASDPVTRNYTLSEILDLYIAHQQKSGIQANTSRRNKSTCGSMISLLGEDVAANNLTARYIMTKLMTADIENSTRNNYLLRFKAMMHWAYKYEYVTDTKYLERIDRFPESSARAKIADKFLESGEVTSLIDGMEAAKWKLMTRFLVLSGLRIGEAIALDDSDVAESISVTKTMDITTGERKIRTKTDCSTREVFIQPELEEVVRDIRQYFRVDKVKHGYRSALFFPGPDGTFVRYPAYEKYLKETSEKLLHRRITPHTLRHTHVSLLAAEGMSLEAIARRVGHEDSKITKEIYFHVTEKMKEKDREEISKIRIL